MATVTRGKTFISGETVEPADMHQLVDSATVTNIVDADIGSGAAIAASKLSTAAQQALIPAGAVMPFAMNSAPSGWLAADGAAVSRSTYAALFAAISTTHGAGDGSTTFNVPDLRGIFVRGSGSQTIDGITYNKTFAAKEGDAMQGHRHGQSPAGGSGGVGVSATGGIYNGTTTSDPVSDTVNGTPRTASETRPANIALLYCIKH